MNLPYICGITFAPFVPAGRLSREDAQKSLRLMKERTHANFVIFAPGALQETPQSEKIDYTSDATMTDDELKHMISYAKELGLLVALKPTVNCKNGVWRAYVSFFDEDVPCEPKWGNWFDSYSDFQTHYARIAQEMDCTMHIAGCEMVMSERRAAEWRQVISAIRREYKGIVSYNTDKYQEHNVTWWDCVDVISSSGYYPIHDWENQLDRIENVVQKFQKPFFFAESGCMSVKGSAQAPNDWTIHGGIDFAEQADWYAHMFQACLGREWLKGIALWSWTDMLYPENDAAKMGDYELFAKPAEQVVSSCYARLQGLFH